MKIREYFRETMAKRRTFERGSLDWEYRTRAAKRFVWLMRGVPTCEWEEREKK